MSGPVESTPRGCRLHLYVAPRASRTAVVGVHDGRVKVQVAAPPADGKANEAIEKFLSKSLGVARSDVVWVSGESGKRKTLDILGLTAEVAAQRLGLRDD